MNLQTLSSRLENDSPQINAYVIPKEDKDLPFYRLRLHRNLTEKFRAFLVNKFESWAEYRKIEFEPSYSPGYKELFKLSLSDYPNILKTYKIFSESSREEDFDRDSNWEIGQYFYKIDFDDNGDEIFAFRARKPTPKLIDNGFLLNLLDGDAYNSIERPEFALDNKIDCLVDGDEMLFRTSHLMRRIFDFERDLKTSSENVLGDLQELEIVSNFDEFEEACLSDRRLMNKLRKIEQDGILNEDIQVGDIKEVIEEVDDEFEEIWDEDEEKLLFNSKTKHRFKILKIFHDDYLTSMLRDKTWEVNSKRSTG